MTRHLLLFASLFFVFGLTAQRFVPLQQIDYLAPPASKQAGFEKMDCSFEELPYTRLRSGETVTLATDIDTLGFGGPNSAYLCLNCEEALFGDAELIGSALRYTATTESQGIDSIQIVYGDTTSQTYSEVQTFALLAQRPDRIVNTAIQPIGPQDELLQAVEYDQLPGGVFCRRFVDDDAYSGRGQLYDFAEDIGVSQDFSFQAARLAGTDRLGVQLCNDLGLCDTYYYFYRVVRGTVAPPFFDDFSYGGIRTDLELWQDEDVLINNTFGLEPPSIGMATFDGLDSYGQPYPTAGNGGGSVIRDFLTSAGVELGGQSGYVLTFYAQPRGLANRPETNDSLVLQFRRPGDDWRTVWARAGLNTGEGDNSDRPFLGYVVPLDPQDHINGFQFRFYNRSNERGSLDHWHVDYVRLDNVATDLNLADIALVSPPIYVTSPYTSMPYRHLAMATPAQVQNELTVSIWNHAANQDLRVNTSSLKIRELETGTALLSTNLLDGPEGDIPPGMPIEKTFDMATTAPYSAFYDQYEEALLNLPNEDEAYYRIVTSYQIAATEETDRPGLVQAVNANNRADQVTELDNYFAYDDGTSELGLEALPNQTVVQEYEAFVPDVLRAVSIRLNRNSADLGDQNLQIHIYLDTLDYTPEYSFDIQPIFVEQSVRDSIQGFTTYELPDSLDLPVGKFYVGWKQISTCDICVPVGYDRNNEANEHIFYRNSGAWYPLLTPITGALMVRPIVGSELDMPSSTDDQLAQSGWLRVYPNPVRDYIHIELIDELPDRVQWQLFDLHGRRLQSGLANGPIDLRDLAAGIYWLRVLDQQGRASTQKIVRTYN